jgi:hypothetical protein
MKSVNYQNRKCLAFSGLFKTCAIHMHNCTYIHTHIHTHIHTYIHTYIHIYNHTYIQTYTHTYIHTYIHTHMHARVHTHTHAHTHTKTKTKQTWGIQNKHILYSSVAYDLQRSMKIEATKLQSYNEEFITNNLGYILNNRKRRCHHGNAICSNDV